MVICDPHSGVNGSKRIIQECDWKLLQNTAIKLINETRAKRRAANKQHVDQICAIDVNSGEHRYFNFGSDNRGQIGHAEALLGYRWRIATDEEEAECAKKDQLAIEEYKLNSPEGKRLFNEEMANATIRMAFENNKRQLEETAKKDESKKKSEKTDKP